MISWILRQSRRLIKLLNTRDTPNAKFLRSLIEQTEQDGLVWTKTGDSPQECYRHKGLHIQFYRTASGDERVSFFVDGHRCNAAIVRYEQVLLTELAAIVRSRHEAAERQRLQEILKSAGSRYCPPGSSCNKLAVAGEGSPERTP